MRRRLEDEFVRLFLKSRGIAWLEDQVVAELDSGPRSRRAVTDAYIAGVGSESLDWDNLRDGVDLDAQSVLFDAALASIDRREVDRLLREQFSRLAPAVRRRLDRSYFSDEVGDEEEERNEP